MGNALIDRIARSLGPDAYDPPVSECGPHPFLAMADFLDAPTIYDTLASGGLINPYPPASAYVTWICARCGGGVLDKIHAAPDALQEVA